jgi:hypothetical protein
MDGFVLAPLAPFLFVLGIIWLSSHRKLEEKRIAARAHDRERGDADPQVTSRVEELEDRVRVLERIVTDGGYDLARKIEALRDERPVEATRNAALSGELAGRLR